MKTTLIILISLSLLCGCEPCPHYDRLQIAAFSGTEKPLHRKPRWSTIPFNTADDVGRSYRVIGFMSCEGNDGEEAAILKAMLYRAADMGADAIILNPQKISQQTITSQTPNTNVSTELIGEPIGHGDRRAFRAEAILFTTTNAP